MFSNSDKQFVLYKFSIQKIFLKIIIYLPSERGEGREKERGRNIGMWEICQSVASCMSPSGDLTCTPGMCPDWELNWWPFGSQASTQSIEPHQPEQGFFYLIKTLDSNSGSRESRHRCKHEVKHTEGSYACSAIFPSDVFVTTCHFILQSTVFKQKMSAQKFCQTLGMRR